MLRLSEPVKGSTGSLETWFSSPSSSCPQCLHVHYRWSCQVTALSVCLWLSSSHTQYFTHNIKFHTSWNVIQSIQNDRQSMYMKNLSVWLHMYSIRLKLAAWWEKMYSFFISFRNPVTKPCFTMRFNKVFWVLGHKAEKSQMFRNLDTFSSHISSICLSVIGSRDLAQPDPLCTWCGWNLFPQHSERRKE